MPVCLVWCFAANVSSVVDETSLEAAYVILRLVRLCVVVHTAAPYQLSLAFSFDARLTGVIGLVIGSVLPQYDI